MTQTTPKPATRWNISNKQGKLRRRFSFRTLAALAIGAALLARGAFIVFGALSSGPTAKPAQSVSYVGVYEPDAPGSYAGVNQFARGIGRQPNIVSYYSHWQTPFNNAFASNAARHGATTLVQIAPKDVPLAAIAAGHYDSYLRSYALAVKAFRMRVILSFGHEMNGTWYSWGFHHTSPSAFVAAWQHIVTIFRQAGARNVTWLWTVNIVGYGNQTPAPNRWWPGRDYVNWVGIDGYYRQPTSVFASVFGPTIADVRELTDDPILIAETAAEPSSGQADKIRDLFDGIRTFHLLGFVWFNEDDRSLSAPGVLERWQLSSPAALAAFRRQAAMFMKPERAQSNEHTAKPFP